MTTSWEAFIAAVLSLAVGHIMWGKRKDKEKLDKVADTVIRLEDRYDNIKDMREDIRDIKAVVLALQIDNARNRRDTNA